MIEYISKIHFRLRTDESLLRLLSSRDFPHFIRRSG